eukprot:gnl/Trimastix_PCT/3512.p1 GENE.gnl/Trimastix_PCT/3512~~gnl/Trimastix_PCT/3512.p1  ORF type:complete len:600 (+),score=70.04 gnl/Trimastix_PCT/3512:266-1801(+)
MDEGQRQHAMLFEGFKMTLFSGEEEGPYEDVPIAMSQNHQECKTLDILVAMLCHIRERIFAHIASEPKFAIEGPFRDEMVQWVLTVPAIWSENSKQHMRVAASLAGLIPQSNSPRLLLALEPEAAALYCRRETLRLAGDFPVGTRYCVLDCGGGTVDIAVHEALEGGEAREIHRPSGGDWGAKTIETRFLQFLEELFGREHLNRVRVQHTSDLLDVLDEFEKVIRRLRSSDGPDQRRQFNIGPFLASYDGDAPSAIAQYNAAHPAEDHLELCRGRLRMCVAKFVSFIVPSLLKISEHMQNVILAQFPNLDYIFLVGGFSECDLMQPYLQSTLQDLLHTTKLVQPFRPGMAVVQGALLFGQNPAIIVERRARLCYGVKYSTKVEEWMELPEHARFFQEGESLYVADLFDKFITVDEPIPIHKSVSREFTPLSTSQQNASIELYSTPDPEAQFTRECARVSVPEINIRVAAGDTPLHDRVLKVTLFFGLTNIEVKAEYVPTGQRMQVACLLDQ